MCVSVKIFCPTTQSAGPITACQKHTACVVGLQGGNHSTVRSYRVTLPRYAYYNKGARKVFLCCNQRASKRTGQIQVQLSQQGPIKGHYEGKMRD